MLWVQHVKIMVRSSSHYQVFTKTSVTKLQSSLLATYDIVVSRRYGRNVAFLIAFLWSKRFVSIITKQ
jgi:hypothetical protein